MISLSFQFSISTGGCEPLGLVSLCPNSQGNGEYLEKLRCDKYGSPQVLAKEKNHEDFGVIIPYCVLCNFSHNAPLLLDPLRRS